MGQLLQRMTNVWTTLVDALHWLYNRRTIERQHVPTSEVKGEESSQLRRKSDICLMEKETDEFHDTLLTQESSEALQHFPAALDAMWEELVDYMNLDSVSEELEKAEVFRRSTLRDIKEKNSTTSEKINALLQLVRDEGKQAYVQLKQCLNTSGQETLVNKIEKVEKGEYKPASFRKMRTMTDILLEALKEDLIKYYRERESTMSVAPLVEQHEAELTKFYVKPPMMMHNKPNAFGQSEEYSRVRMLKGKTKIRSYRELFFNGNDPYRKIYVTADAGMGKTSFAKMLAVMWCEAHSRANNTSDDSSASEKTCPDKEIGNKSVTDNCKDVTCQGDLGAASLDAASKTSQNIRPENSQTILPYRKDAVLSNIDDLETMHEFEFLLLIKLREFKRFDKCTLDEMIFEMMSSKLPHANWYNKEFLQEVLCNKQCLIVVDGLDEWVHPQSCERDEVIPHSRIWSRCTVLTTTRPWKLSTARLVTKDIDQEVEISELDEVTAQELECRAIEFLNDNQTVYNTDQLAANNATKTVSNFEKSLTVVKLVDILYIPFVLLQMICLWFGNCPIGKSFCEVYSNIIELTLTRWLIKTDSGHTHCQCESSIESLKSFFQKSCMKNNVHCLHFMSLLLKIGELAFRTLFGGRKEESLLFKATQAKEYMNDKEIQNCLDMGLLSQVKDSASLTTVRLQLYFPHKSLHEFFCALFIASHWDNIKSGHSVKETVSERCKLVSDILEMSKVFQFVCGLDPEVYYDISIFLSAIVGKDQSVIASRKQFVEFHFRNSITDYQVMQVSCFLESSRNIHHECKIQLEDVILDDMIAKDEQQALEKILSHNSGCLKSLVVKFGNQKGDLLSNFVPILEQSEWSSLQGLCITGCHNFYKRIPRFIHCVLTTAVHSLKYLELAYVSINVEDACAMQNLDNLQSLCLRRFDISQDGLKKVTAYIRSCLSLEQLRICSFFEKQDKTEEPDQCFPVKYIENLLSSIEAKTNITHLTLCQDNYAGRHSMDLSKHSNLREIVLDFPLTMLHINPKNLIECKVDRMSEFCPQHVSSFLKELCGAPILETLSLSRTRTPPKILLIPELPQLTKFILSDFLLRDNSLQMSPELTNLETIVLCKTTMSNESWQNLFTSISKLPQPITMELRSLEMTVGEWNELFLSVSKLRQKITIKMDYIRMAEEEWRKLFFDILGKLSKQIHLEMQRCEGPSQEAWRNILYKLKSSKAFCNIYIDHLGSTIIFNTVGV